LGMRDCYLDSHEAGLCCYLVIYIENLLRPLQLFYYNLWSIYSLSLVCTVHKVSSLSADCVTWNPSPTFYWITVHPENGDNIYFWAISELLPDSTALHFLNIVDLIVTAVTLSNPTNYRMISK
jgi:hypothetical protein